MRGWYRHVDPAIQSAAEYLPTQKDLSPEPIKARAFANELANIERINQLMASAEARRDAALQSIQRRKAAFAESLRGALQNIEDAEFETIEPDGTRKQN